MSERLNEKMLDVISVCARKADIYEYLSYKVINNQRFIARSRTNRNLYLAEPKLFEEVLRTSSLGTYSLKTPQKAPNIKWAYDSKRTGVIGWNCLWRGWFRLMDKVDAYIMRQKKIRSRDRHKAGYVRSGVRQFQTLIICHVSSDTCR